jgi:hypothetical protein
MFQLDGDRLHSVESAFHGEEAVEADAGHLTAQRMPVERHLVSGGGIHVRLLALPEPDAGPRISVIGDAASVPLLPWLAESATRLTFFWTSTPPMEPVELELPNVVLHLIRYRDLRVLADDHAPS